MRITFLIAVLLVGATAAAGQARSSVVEIVTTYSQNEKFYLRSVPYDNEYPSLRGRTFVYEKGSAAPLYVLDRGFDSVERDSNNLILSNNGEIILYVIPFRWGVGEEKEDLRSVTIYKNGRLLRSFTEAEITGCDEKAESWKEWEKNPQSR